MFLIWRRFVVWLRTLLLKLSRKEKVEWDKEIVEVVDIVHDALDKQQPSEPKNEPKNEPKLPNYDIIGKVPREKRRFFRLFRRK
jgi:hypothetical protein